MSSWPEWTSPDGRIRLINADCLEVLPTLAAGSVDAVVTDPPYNVSLKYESHDDDMTPDNYESWCRQWFRECQRITPRMVVFPGHGNLPMWYRIRDGKSGLGCWYKPGNPARGGVFQFCEFEPFLLFGCSASCSDVIRATVTKQAGVGCHPCPKPLPLFVQLLGRLRKVDVVLDPFAGSFTTAIACIRTGRKCIAIEKEAKYFAIGVERVKAELAKTALLDKAEAVA